MKNFHQSEVSNIQYLWSGLMAEQEFLKLHTPDNNNGHNPEYAWLSPSNTCMLPFLFNLTALSGLQMKTPVDIYILPEVAPWQGYMSCDGTSCPRCKKAVFILQEQRRGRRIHGGITAASCSHFLPPGT